MNNKKVLIISYYWPPSGGAGVQRWLKFTKYLPENGWTPVVYTPANPHYPVLDETLAKDIPDEAEIIKCPIWEPYGFYKKLMGMKKGERVQHGFIAEKGQNAWKQKISTWIRGNLFIPDARKFWVKPSIRFLLKYLKENEVDAIVSTGPPHSTHLIAMGVKQKTGLPWLADFRDPWTEIDFYHQLMLTKWGDGKHRALEAKVLKNADLTVAIGWNMGKGLKRLGAEKVEVITNGFDGADFESGSVFQKNDHFEMVHIGSLNKDRNPHDLWQVLEQLTQNHPSFSKKLRITLIGKVDQQVIQAIENHRLTPYLNLVAYMPHNEIFPFLKKATVLLLPLNNVPTIEGIITGKIFEYLAAQRPILCIGSTTGDAARIIEGADAGDSINFGETNQLKDIIDRYFRGYEENGLQLQSVGVEQYSRKNLTGQLVKCLNKLVVDC